MLDVRPMDGEGLFTLSLEGSRNGGHRITVRDAIGRDVLARSTGATVLQREPLDLRGLSAGAYTVTVRSADAQWTARVVRP